jgi:predicted ester cyclase
VSYTDLRALLTPLRRAQYDFEERAVRGELGRLLTDDARVQLCCPLDTVIGPDAFYDRAYRDLLAAMPDLERRDTIVIAGPTPKGDEWVGCCGYYTGTFRRPWLDIPATGHMASIRFHEFYRVVGAKVVEIQSIWDIPELMMQAGAWPMAPSLGREWHVPGPASEDGLARHERDEELSRHAFAIVFDMCAHLGKFAESGVEGMRLPAFWHPRCSWYGPSGIGTCRGIEGFRNWHQIPFLRGMPNRVGNAAAGHMFADNGYVGFTAWPGMSMTISEDGWLGIPPVDREITMRSLDFWRVEGDRIRENWVLVDLLDVYRQIGVDVLRRMREFNKARGPAPMEP